MTDLHNVVVFIKDEAQITLTELEQLLKQNIKH